MLSIKGALRLFPGVQSAIGLPTYVKVAPFSVPDIMKIPAIREKDRATSTSPHFMEDHNDIVSFSCARDLHFGDYTYNTPNDFGT